MSRVLLRSVPLSPGKVSLSMHNLGVAPPWSLVTVISSSIALNCNDNKRYTHLTDHIAMTKGRICVDTFCLEIANISSRFDRYFK